MSDTAIRIISLIGLFASLAVFGMIMNGLGYNEGRQDYLRANQHLFWINDELVGKVRFDELNGIYWISTYEKKYFRTEK